MLSHVLLPQGLSINLQVRKVAKNQERYQSDALIKIAGELEREEAVAELQARHEKYSANPQRLWDEETGLILNRRTDTNEPNHRVSPTNFYPLLAKAATPARVVMSTAAINFITGVRCRV